MARGLKCRALAYALVLATFLSASVARAQSWEQHPEFQRLVGQASEMSEAFNAGDYPRALRICEAMHARLEATAGRDNVVILFPLTCQANARRAMGEYDAARALLQRAIRLSEQAGKGSGARYFQPLAVLSIVEFQAGDLDRAEELTEQALALIEKWDPKSGRAATLYSNLGILKHSRGDLDGADQAYRIAEERLALSERADTGMPASLEKEYVILGQGDRVNLLNNRSSLAIDRFDYVTAERLLIQAIEYGKAHALESELETVYFNLAVVRRRQDKLKDLLSPLREGLAVMQRRLALVLSGSSEAQKVAYLKELDTHVDTTVSLATSVLSENDEALALAFQAVMMRKGRTLDATIDVLDAFRQRAGEADRRTLDELLRARREFDTASGRGGASTEALAARLDQLERAVAERSVVFRADSTKVAFEQVQAALPEGAALVEYVSFVPFESDQSRARVGAFVVRKHERLAYVGVGEEAEVARLVRDLRSELTLRRADWLGPAKALRERVFDPVEAKLGGARLVFLATDGPLHVAPFAALVRDDGEPLVRRYAFDYVTSGRDMLRFAGPLPPLRTRPLVVAAPDFDDTSSLGAAAGAPLLPRRQFRPLPGAASEAEALEGVLESRPPLVGKAATERALRAARGPSILHVATHGFFLPNEPAPTSPRARPKAHNGGPATPPSPLLRSGVALAGANVHRAPPDDGVLTAQEAASLDLWGTRIVTLSACDTGVGDAVAHEGVFGLRRALLLAGSQSQLLTLWQVDDRATVSL